MDNHSLTSNLQFVKKEPLRYNEDYKIDDSMLLSGGCLENRNITEM